MFDRYDDAAVEPLRQAHYREVVSRLQSAMASDGLDALVVIRKDFFTWVNAHPSEFLHVGMQSMAMIVVPRSGDPVGICCDHEIEAMQQNGAVRDWRVYMIWSGHEKRYRTGAPPRYATLDQSMQPEKSVAQMRALSAVIEDLGLGRAKLGVELPELKNSVMSSLREALPHAVLIDSQPLFMRTWLRKTPYEIHNLRHAAHWQWRVTHQVMMAIRPGDSYADIRKRIEVGAASAPGVESIVFLMLYMGRSASATQRHFDRKAEAGDFISIDLAFQCRGYGSDSGRAYILGEPNAMQRRIADIYHAAHEAVKKQMKPGARVGDLYDMAAEMVRSHGLSDFRRGHIGHGLGCCTYVEEAPFIAHGGEARLEPGMVVTLEVPFYGPGFGAYFEEDILLITDTGHESLTQPPFGLHVISC